MGIFSKLREWLTNPTTTNKTPREHIDYILGEYFPGEAESPISTVKVLTGPYKGVEFCYLNVRLSEHAGTAQLSFKYSFVDTADYTREVLKSSPEFVTLAGTILESLLLREGGINDSVTETDE